jgi:predicted transcriptional regulator of viral defense system
MEFSTLYPLVNDLPVFSSSLLQTGEVVPAYLQKQLTLWVKSGKLIQLRRGLYTLPEPYRKTDPHPFTIANQLVTPSYISLQSALAYYNLIPEDAPNITSVTSRKRTGVVSTPLGNFTYHSIKTAMFTGFHLQEVSHSQNVFLARPEKALLDLIYLTPDGENPAFLKTLRLQNLNTLDFDWLQTFTKKLGKNKLMRAIANLELLASEEEEYKSI